MEKQPQVQRRRTAAAAPGKSGVSIVLWVALIAFVAFRARQSFAHYHNVQQQFHGISQGLPATWVLEKLGKPTVHDGKCGVVVTASADCKLEYVYGHPFTPLTQDYYVVEFDAQKLVIDTQHVDRQ